MEIKNKDYRSDIDGLRAIAILSVLIYHIDSSVLTGGFTGVDVFFVFSGFLITSHILSEIDSIKGFSIAYFYFKRIRRIIPALLVMVLFSLLVGYFVLTSYYLQSLGEQALSAILSFSNIHFHLTSGYFDLVSGLKPLLHTWSLGVEEQFYLVWPAVLVLFTFFTKAYKHILILMASLMLLSLFLNRFFIDNQEAIFYLMPFRIFEFLYWSWCCSSDAF